MAGSKPGPKKGSTSRTGSKSKNSGTKKSSKSDGRKSTGGRKYGKKSQEMVESAMRRKKRGTLKSGRSGKTVKSRKQAIAIGLSEAREKGAKVPKKKSGK